MWYGRAALRGRNHRLARRVLVAWPGFLLLLGGLPATGPAQSPGVGALRERGAPQLAAPVARGRRSSCTRSEPARSRPAPSSRGSTRERRRSRQEQAAAAPAVPRSARQPRRVAQQQLGAQLRLLYEQDEPDPIAVILGSATLNDVIEGLDTIKRIAHATESVLDQAKHARTRVAKQRRHLAAKVASTAGGSRERGAERTEPAGRRGGTPGLHRAAAHRAAAERPADRSGRAARGGSPAACTARHRPGAAAAPPATATTPSTPSAPDTAQAAQTPQEATTTFEPATTASPGEPPPPAVESVSQSRAAPTSSAPGPPRSGGIDERLRDGLLPEGNDGDRAAGRARDRRRRPDGDPARHADDASRATATASPRTRAARSRGTGSTSGSRRAAKRRGSRARSRSRLVARN